MPFDLDKFAKIVLPPEPEGSDAALIKSMDELTAAIKERQQTPPAEPPLPKTARRKKIKKVTSYNIILDLFNLLLISARGYDIIL